MASTTTRAKTPAAKVTRARKTAEPKAPAADGQKLYRALLARAKQAKAGDVVEHKDGLYARLQVAGRTAAYIVRGKTVATVYPNTLAASMPKEVSFRRVALGAHHYGRGEVVVAVAGEGDFDNAVAALKAAAVAPAVPKKPKVEA